MKMKLPTKIEPNQHVRWALSDLGYETETMGHYFHYLHVTLHSMRSIPLYSRIVHHYVLKAVAQAKSNDRK
jgi:hypothetical protein